MGELVFWSHMIDAFALRQEVPQEFLVQLQEFFDMKFSK